MADNTTARRLAFLSGIAPFEDLTNEELLLILDDLRAREYARDDIIFRQGDESREIYIVFKGKARIYKVSPAGNETSIAIFGEGELIGEMAAIEPGPRSTTVKAVNKVVLLTMSYEAFNRHLRSIHRLSLGLNRLLVEKLRWTASFAETVAQFDAAGRLLHVLLLHNQQYGETVTTDEGNTHHVLKLSLNQTDLASMVGARREWINRILRDWRKRGLLEYDNGILTIFDLQRVMDERDGRIEASGGEW